MSSRRTVTPASTAQEHAGLVARAAAADLVRAAERFLEHGANAFMSHGSSLVEEAKERGCKFALRIMLPDGRARVDVVTAEGESVRLFEVAVVPSTG